MPDIYFHSNYGKLYEEMENGESTIFEYEDKHGKIKHMFIKRQIPKMGEETYYDIVTPYGYGGPIIIETTDTEKLVAGFQYSFKDYCIENKIVSEFVRFHPIYNNSVDFNEMYDITYLRKTVATSIDSDSNPFMNEFSKSTRKTIRRALNNGLNYRIVRAPSSLEEFKGIYYSTMNRNEATDYYYFDDQYFNGCIELFKKDILLAEVLYEDKVIAASLNFISDDKIHVHLSGTLTEYLRYSPAYVLKYGVLMWAKENGITLIHYGGGTSNSLEDPLYKFKRKFTKKTEFDFCIGKKIWNQEVYQDLCRVRNVEAESDFFPAYRKGL